MFGPLFFLASNLLYGLFVWVKKESENKEKKKWKESEMIL